jgi:peptidoglycan/xylan/chitin deacetylase (PgdA/CDA1 family)
MITPIASARRRWLGGLLTLMLIGLLATAVWALQSQSTVAPSDALVIAPPRATQTFTPEPTHTLTPRPTSTPRPTTTPTPAPPTPAPTATPTIIFTPIPRLPPASDGVKRSVNVPILMYHYISIPPSLNDRIRVGLSVPPDTFDAEMKMLSDNGYHTISLFDLYGHLATGKSLPDKPIVITFDDGYIDNYQNAFPVLKKYGFVATFFVLTAPPDKGDPAYMSWNMLKDMSDAGMDIQIHARDHVDLRRRNYDYLFYQIYGGRQSIEGHTGKPVVFIAYPSGKYDDAVLRFLTAHHFWAALTTNPGRTHTLQDALTWTRVRIAGQLTLDGFAKLMSIR